MTGEETQPTYVALDKPVPEPATEVERLRAEVEQVRQALRYRDSDIVQEQIGDDARAEHERLRAAAEDVLTAAERREGLEAALDALAAAIQTRTSG